MLVKTSRRAFLRGTAAILPLPFFESLFFRNSQAMAQNATRAAFVPIYWPYGTKGNALSVGSHSDFASAAAAIGAYKELESSGKMDQISAIADVFNPCGHWIVNVGAHERARSSYLTGVYTNLGSPANDVRNGPSADQLIAQHFIDEGIHRSQSTHMYIVGPNFDQVFGKKYYTPNHTHISWKVPEKSTDGFARPSSPASSPQQFFSRLVGKNAPVSKADQSDAELRLILAQSAISEYQDLKRQLSRCDKCRLEEYLDDWREMEKNLLLTLEGNGSPAANLINTSCEEPSSLSAGTYEQHVDLYFQLIKSALQCDASRVIPYMMGTPGSWRFANISISNHHGSTHSAGSQNAVLETTHWYHRKFAGFLQSLPDDVLSRTLVTFGSGLNDGDSHDPKNIPLLIAGGRELGHQGNKIIKVGSKVQDSALSYSGVPLSAVWLNVMRMMGLPQSKFSAFGGDTKLSDVKAYENFNPDAHHSAVSSAASKSDRVRSGRASATVSYSKNGSLMEELKSQMG